MRDLRAIADQLAALTGGTRCVYNVLLRNGVALSVDEDRVDICREVPGRPLKWERLPMRMSYEEMAAYALKIANLQPGEVVPALSKGYSDWTYPAPLASTSSSTAA